MLLSGISFIQHLNAICISKTKTTEIKEKGKGQRTVTSYVHELFITLPIFLFYLNNVNGNCFWAQSIAFWEERYISIIRTSNIYESIIFRILSQYMSQYNTYFI